MYIIAYFSHILIIVVLFGETAASGFLRNYRSSKTVQPVYCIQEMKTILISCSRESAGYDRLVVATSVMMFKSLHGLTPEYLQSRFVSRDDITSY